MRRPLVASYFSSILSTKSDVSKLIWQVIFAPQFLREKIHKLSKDKSASLTSKAEQSGRSILVSDALGVLLPPFLPELKQFPLYITGWHKSPGAHSRSCAISLLPLNRLTATLFFLSVTEQSWKCSSKHPHFTTHTSSPWVDYKDCQCCKCKIRNSKVKWTRNIFLSQTLLLIKI